MRILLSLLLAASAASLFAADNWPSYRGPTAVSASRRNHCSSRRRSHDPPAGRSGPRVAFSSHCRASAACPRRRWASACA